MLNQSSAQALARLRAYKPPPTQWYNCPLSRRAAVLILLYPGRNGELKVVLTMRASTLRNYAGQVALPGGKADTPTEDPFSVARREAYEEIGLSTTDAKLPPGFSVEHLCEMPTNLAKTELGVRPCVAYLSSTSSSSSSSSSSTSSSNSSSSSTSEEPNAVEEKLIPRLDPKEVSAVFTAPFANFLHKTWPPHSPSPGPAPHSWYRGTWTDWHSSRWRMHNFYVPRSASAKLDPAAAASLEEEGFFRVFGMTARILVDAARVAYAVEPEFEHNSHFGDEELIGRLVRSGRMGERERERDKAVSRGEGEDGAREAGGSKL